MKIFISGIAFAMGAVAVLFSAGNETVLAKNALAVCPIVVADGANDSEKYAAQELSSYLGKITGAAFTLTTESKFVGGNSAVYVGPTLFAIKNGITTASLADEEWIIRFIGLTATPRSFPSVG